MFYLILFYLILSCLILSYLVVCCVLWIQNTQYSLTSTKYYLSFIINHSYLMQ